MEDDDFDQLLAGLSSDEEASIELSEDDVVSPTAVNEDSVALIAKTCKVDHDTAEEALNDAGGDMVEAIVQLQAKLAGAKEVDIPPEQPVSQTSSKSTTGTNDSFEMVQFENLDSTEVGENQTSMQSDFATIQHDYFKETQEIKHEPQIINQEEATPTNDDVDDERQTEPSDFEFDGGKKNEDENLFGDGEIPTPTKADFQFGADDDGAEEDLFSPSPNGSAERADASSPRTQDELFFVSPLKSNEVSETDNFQQPQAYTSDSVEAFDNSGFDRGTEDALISREDSFSAPEITPQDSFASDFGTDSGPDIFETQPSFASDFSNSQPSRETQEEPFNDFSTPTAMEQYEPAPDLFGTQEPDPDLFGTQDPDPDLFGTQEPDPDLFGTGDANNDNQPQQDSYQDNLFGSGEQRDSFPDYSHEELFRNPDEGAEEKNEFFQTNAETQQDDDNELFGTEGRVRQDLFDSQPEIKEDLFAPEESTQDPFGRPPRNKHNTQTQNSVNFNLEPSENDPFGAPNGGSFDPIGDLFSSNPDPGPTNAPMPPLSPPPHEDDEPQTDGGFTFDDFADGPSTGDVFSGTSPRNQRNFLAPPRKARNTPKEKIGSPKGVTRADDSLFDSFSSVKEDVFKPTKTTTFHQTTNFNASSNRAVPSRSFESPSVPPQHGAQSRSPPTSRLSRSPHERAPPNYSYSENYTSESGHFHQTPYSNESDIRASSSIDRRSRSSALDQTQPISRGTAPSRSKLGYPDVQSRSLSSRNIPPPAPKQPSQPDRRERSRPPRGLVSRSRDPGRPTGGPGTRSRDPISESRDPARSREPHPRRGRGHLHQVPEEHERTVDQIPHRSRHRSLDPGPEFINNVQTVDREVSDVRKNRRGTTRRVPPRTRRTHTQDRPSEPLENIKEHEAETSFPISANPTPIIADPNREPHGKPPHAFVRFGFGGKMLRVNARKSQKGKYTVSISFVHDRLRNTEFVQSMQKFPGPINEKQEKDLKNFLNQKAATQPDYTQDSQSQSMVKLWKLMNTMYQNPDAKKMLRKMIMIILDGKTPPPVEVPEFTPEEIANARLELNNSLFLGNPHAAVTAAVKNHLWADAFAIAMKCCPTRQAEVLAEYGKSLEMSGVFHTPMHTLYLSAAGRGDELTNDIATHEDCDWAEHAAILLSNLCRENQQTLKSIGTKLWKSGDCPSAHVCYICAGVALEKEKCPILLLGGNHQNGKCANWRRVQPIQLTEVYEAAKKKRDPKFLLPSLQVSKLIYARYLAEVGLSERALLYCDAIAVELGKMGKSDFAMMGKAGERIKKDVEELSNRLKIFLNKKSLGGRVTGLASTIGSYFFSAEKKPEKVVYEKAWLPRRKGDSGANSPVGNRHRTVRRGATRQVHTKGDPTRTKRGVRNQPAGHQPPNPTTSRQPMNQSTSRQPTNLQPSESNPESNRGRRPSIQNANEAKEEAPLPTRPGRRAPRQKAEPARRGRPTPVRRPTEKADPSKEKATRFDPSIQDKRRRPNFQRAKKEAEVPRVSSDGALVDHNGREALPRSRSRPVISPRESPQLHQIEEESETTTEEDIEPLKRVQSPPDMSRERSRAEDPKRLGRPPIKRSRDDENRPPRARPRARPKIPRSNPEPKEKEEEISAPPMKRTGSRGRIAPRPASRSRLPPRAQSSPDLPKQSRREPRPKLPAEGARPERGRVARDRMPRHSSNPDLSRAGHDEALSPTNVEEVRHNEASDQASPPPHVRTKPAAVKEDDRSDPSSPRSRPRARPGNVRARAPAVKRGSENQSSPRPRPRARPTQDNEPNRSPRPRAAPSRGANANEENEANQGSPRPRPNASRARPGRANEGSGSSDPTSPQPRPSAAPRAKDSTDAVPARRPTRARPAARTSRRDDAQARRARPERPSARGPGGLARESEEEDASAETPSSPSETQRRPPGRQAPGETQPAPSRRAARPRRAGNARQARRPARNARAPPNAETSEENTASNPPTNPPARTRGPPRRRAPRRR